VTVTVTDAKGRSMTLSAPSFPPSMAGRCRGFTAWFLTKRPGSPLRARWTDADGRERCVEVAGVEWLEGVDNDFHLPVGEGEFSPGDPGLQYVG
jgi:hypothetical protein